MSFKLVLKFKGTVIAEFPLDHEETTIGRKSDTTIHIDNLAVSSLHARILKIGKKVILEDMGSTNGTLVNNQAITKHILKHGDVISIGKHTLNFVVLADASESEPATEPESDMDKTMIISASARAEMLSESTASAAAAMTLGVVQYLSGPLMGKTVELKSSLTSIGKGDNCKLPVKGMLVGKQAAVITRRPSGYHITYLEGMSKVKVNGETISGTPKTLEDSDIIELSDVKMQFFIKK